MIIIEKRKRSKKKREMKKKEEGRRKKKNYSAFLSLCSQRSKRGMESRPQGKASTKE
jgi:hypothetical protein